MASACSAVSSTSVYRSCCAGPSGCCACSSGLTYHASQSFRPAISGSRLSSGENAATLSATPPGEASKPYLATMGTWTSRQTACRDLARSALSSPAAAKAACRRSWNSLSPYWSRSSCCMARATSLVSCGLLRGCAALCGPASAGTPRAPSCSLAEQPQRLQRNLPGARPSKTHCLHVGQALHAQSRRPTPSWNSSMSGTRCGRVCVKGSSADLKFDTAVGASWGRVMTSTQTLCNGCRGEAASCSSPQAVH
mmetsp:Transcript_71/g.212  ORF Transcript_71/g.212 Transcript_71/m.212 type:complete len:252 (+) Transcript_71:57-812(+)